MKEQKIIKRIDLIKFHLLQERLYSLLDLQTKKAIKLNPVPLKRIKLIGETDSNAPQIVID